MEEIIDDVPPSYRQLEDLAEYQIDYLINLMVGEWKTYAQWIWKNWDFDTLSEFCARIRAQHADLYEEAMDEGAQEDVATTKLKEEQDVIKISSDEESQEDDEGPPAESNDEMGHKEPWIQKLKD